MNWPTNTGRNPIGTWKVICRPNPAPRGAYRGRAPQMTAYAPPNENCAPPSEDCAPKKLTGSGLLEYKSRPKLVDFMTFLGWDFFFGDHLFTAGKTAWISDSSRKMSWNFWKDLFLGGDHPFSAGKTAWISDFGRKIPLNLCSSPCSFEPDREKFLVLPCPSRIHTK